MRTSARFPLLKNATQAFKALSADNADAATRIAIEYFWGKHEKYEKDGRSPGWRATRMASKVENFQRAHPGHKDAIAIAARSVSGAKTFDDAYVAVFPPRPAAPATLSTTAIAR
jgi:hypothetical protein